MITLAVSESFFRLAFGGFVQLVLRCPLLPHLKQIGEGRPLPFPFEPDEDELEPFVLFPLPFPFLPPFDFAFAFPFGRDCGLRPKRGCRPESAGTTTG